VSTAEPVSRRDYARLWIEITRRRLRGEWPADAALPDAALPDSQQLPLDDDEPEF
jgi:hypothetical protein